MTKLDCTVTGCLYNMTQSCCKDNIEVVGKDARHSRDTFCNSFREKKDSVRSSVDYPTKETRVICKAAECTFNVKNYCQAKHIGISGSNGHTCRETECTTFRCKCD